MSNMPNVPVSGNAREHLMAVAARLFAKRGYAAVNVTAIARAAGVTTGALYHHFNSKAGLYQAVRLDLEERIVACMEEAAVTRHKLRPAARAALHAGLETCHNLNAARIVSEPLPETSQDAIGDFFLRLCGPERAARAALLTVLFRSSLAVLHRGQTLEQTSSALEWLL